MKQSTPSETAAGTKSQHHCENRRAVASRKLANVLLHLRSTRASASAMRLDTRVRSNARAQLTKYRCRMSLQEASSSLQTLHCTRPTLLLKPSVSVCSWERWDWLANRAHSKIQTCTHILLAMPVGLLKAVSTECAMTPMAETCLELSCEWTASTSRLHFVVRASPDQAAQHRESTIASAASTQRDTDFKAVHCDLWHWRSATSRQAISAVS